MKGQPLKRWSTIVLGAAAAYGVGHLYQPVVVLGASMEPALHSGQLVWADRLYFRTHKPQRGDVVVFWRNRVPCIKRVYRAPGEEILYRGSFQDIVLPMREAAKARWKPASPSRRLPVRTAVKQMRLPDTHVFVVGDNFVRSEDSRHFGPVALRDVIGRIRVETDATRTLPCEISPPLRRKAPWYRRAWEGLWKPREQKAAPRRAAEQDST